MQMLVGIEACVLCRA